MLPCHNIAIIDSDVNIYYSRLADHTSKMGRCFLSKHFGRAKIFLQKSKFCLLTIRSTRFMQKQIAVQEKDSLLTILIINSL